MQQTSLTMIQVSPPQRMCSGCYLFVDWCEKGGVAPDLKSDSGQLLRWYLGGLPAPEYESTTQSSTASDLGLPTIPLT
jgi:hypothetical protein